VTVEIAIKQIENVLAACDHHREVIRSLRSEITETKREWEQDQAKNAALRQAAVEVCAIGRVWVTIWGDKLSEDSVRQFAELEKQILTK
jgi:hypothetical protein